MPRHIRRRVGLVAPVATQRDQFSNAPGALESLARGLSFAATAELNINCDSCRSCSSIVLAHIAGFPMQCIELKIGVEKKNRVYIALCDYCDVDENIYLKFAN